MEDKFNHSSVGLPTPADSIQEPVEVQWDLEDKFNHSSVRAASDLGGGITDFEEPYTSKVSSLPTQLVDIKDEGGTGWMFEPWEFSNWAGENEQANLFPEVEL